MNLDRVHMKHPDVAGDPVNVSRVAFDRVHAKNGWEIVDDDDVPAPAPLVQSPPLEAMDRDGLVIVAGSRGIEVKSGDTKPQIIDKIRESGYPGSPDVGTSPTS